MLNGAMPNNVPPEVRNDIIQLARDDTPKAKWVGGDFKGLFVEHH